MEIGDTLRDDGRFEIDELVASGRSYQIVRCLDREHGDREVYAKAPMVDVEDDEGNDRHEALAVEFDLLERGYDGLPTPVELIDVAVEGRRLPVLVYEPISGDTLFDFVAKRPPGTIPVEMLLATVREVGGVCRTLHDDGLLYRDFDPRHVLVAEEGEFRGMVGAGNITPIEERPRPPVDRLAGAAYAAPEIRNERSGETLRPAADVYGLAALLSYAVTGQEPTTAVESPLEPEAYEALRAALADGLEELVASGLQPVAKHRLSLEEFLAHADETGLAKLTDPDRRSELDIQPLPEPWSGAQPPEVNRAEQSNLSPGPLISVPTDGSSAADGDEVEGVKSAPVEEFLGEGSDDDADSEGRTDAAGEPVRSVSMVDENLGEGAGGDADVDWERRAEESALPRPSELPLGMRVGLGIGVPILLIAVVVLLGFLGVY